MSYPLANAVSVASISPKIIGDYGVLSTKPALIAFDFDFQAENQYNINLGLMQMAQTFGIPRSIYINNKYNPNEVLVYINGTNEVLSVPAFTIGMLPISALANDSINLYSVGGTPSTNPKVHVEVFNYERNPYTYAGLAPFQAGSNVQALTPAAVTITARNTTLLAGVPANVFPTVANVRNIAFRNVGDGAGGGDVAWWQTNVTATGSFDAGDNLLQPGEPMLILPYTTAQRISFISAGGTRIQAFEWTN